MGRTFKRKLTATGQTIIKSWDSGKGDGKETHLWKVEAVDEDGNAVTEDLRAFAELELGIPYDYEIERYESKKGEVSYTVKKPRANSAQRLAEVEEQLRGALERLAVVEERLGLAPPA